MSELDERLLRKIVEYNKSEIDKSNGDVNEVIDELIILEYEGHSIWNPFMDETMRFEVVPEEKYGADKLNKFINKYEG